MISQHVYELQVAGRPGPVDGGTVTVDEGWSPYIQADIVVSPALAADLDPRGGDRAYLWLIRRHGTSWLVADLTEYAGATTAAWTASMAGGGLAAWTGALSQPFNASHLESQQTLMDLMSVDVDIDWEAERAEVTLASQEVRAQMIGLTSPRAVYPPAPTVQDAAALMVTRIDGAGLVIDLDPPVEVDPEGTRWDPALYAWDWIHPLVGSAGWRLWCDEAGVWNAGPLGVTGPALPVALEDVVELRERTTITQGWADAVMVTWDWTSEAGNRLRRHAYATAAAPGTLPVRTLNVTYDDVPYPGAAQSATTASALLTRALTRGRSYDYAAVSDYTLRPGRRAVITTPAGAGNVIASGVTWDLNTDRMSIRTRDEEA